jgi:hypothetical protein
MTRPEDKLWGGTNRSLAEAQLRPGHAAIESDGGQALVSIRREINLAVRVLGGF